MTTPWQGFAQTDATFYLPPQRYLASTYYMSVDFSQTGSSSIPLYRRGGYLVEGDLVPERLAYWDGTRMQRLFTYGADQFGYYSQDAVIDASRSTSGYSFGGFFTINAFGDNLSIIGNWTPSTSSGALLTQLDSSTLAMHHEGHVTTYPHQMIPGVLRHYIVTLDPTDQRQRLYLDGQLVAVGEPVPSVPLSSSTNFHVGAGLYDTVYPDMDFYAFGWWQNKALTPTEVYALAYNIDVKDALWTMDGSNSPAVMA